MSILDERTGIAIEVYRLFRVKEHLLLRIDFQNEVLESTKSNHGIQPVFFLFRKFCKFAAFL